MLAASRNFVARWTQSQPSSAPTHGESPLGVRTVHKREDAVAQAHDRAAEVRGREIKTAAREGALLRPIPAPRRAMAGRPPAAGAAARDGAAAAIAAVATVAGRILAVLVVAGPALPRTALRRASRTACTMTTLNTLAYLSRPPLRLPPGLPRPQLDRSQCSSADEPLQQMRASLGQLR